MHASQRIDYFACMLSRLFFVFSLSSLLLSARGGVIREVLPLDRPRRIDRFGPLNPPFTIISHLLRPHSPNIRSPRESSRIVESGIREPNIIVWTHEETAGSGPEGGDVEVGGEDRVLGRFGPDGGVEEIGVDRGGRYEGVVRCGGRGGRGEVGEVPESEGIGRRGGGGGGRRGGGEQGRRRKYAAKMTTRGKEG